MVKIHKNGTILSLRIYFSYILLCILFLFIEYFLLYINNYRIYIGRLIIGTILIISACELNQIVLWF